MRTPLREFWRELNWSDLKQTIQFFAFTFVVSWTFFLGGAAVRTQAAPLSLVFLLIGTITPAIIALLLESRASGVPALLERVVQWRVPVQWYVFAIGYMLATKLCAALIHRAAWGVWPRFGNEAWPLIVVAILFSTPVQAGEELGWRGYALPRLAQQIGYARGSLLLGVVWGLWHLPLFFIPGVDNYGQSFGVFVLGTTALSVAVAWLYMHTNGSLLLTMLMHSAVNQTVGVVPSAVPDATNPFAWNASRVAWLTQAILWIGSVYFLFRMRQIESSGADMRPAPRAAEI
jgi:membrane protease YdiL (CAAX protease family)